MSEDRDHYVYIIAHVSKETGQAVGPVKVGITRNVTSRLATIQTSAPSKLELFAAFKTPSRETAFVLETGFHEVNKKHRAHGEWFDIDPFRAMYLMCGNIRAMLTKWLELEGDDLDRALEFSGVYRAEEIIDGVMATQPGGHA